MAKLKWSDCQILWNDQLSVASFLWTTWMSQPKSENSCYYRVVLLTQACLPHKPSTKTFEQPCTNWTVIIPWYEEITEVSNLLVISLFIMVPQTTFIEGAFWVQIYSRPLDQNQGVSLSYWTFSSMSSLWSWDRVIGSLSLTLRYPCVRWASLPV